MSFSIPFKFLTCSFVFGGKIKVTKLHATCCMIRPESSTWTTITFYICTPQFNSIRRHALELPEPSSLEDQTIPMVVGHKAATSLFGIIAFVHCLIVAVDLLHCILLFCIAFSSLIIFIKSFTSVIRLITLVVYFLEVI